MERSDSTSRPAGTWKQGARVWWLALAVVAVAVVTLSATRRNEGVPWIERGLRPGLYNRGLPVSPAFEDYLDTYFTSDPRLRPPQPTYPIDPNPRAKNVILLLGDGMGLAHLQAAAMAAYGAGGRLTAQRMPIVGIVQTWSASSLVTDSGAAATALATGYKTYNGALGVNPLGQPVESFFNTAKRYGKRTGLVATVSLTHATPAAFVANANMRTMEAAVAPQLIERDVNVLLGGGLSFFLPASHPSGYSWRRDERDVLSEALDRGYQLTFAPEELQTLQGERVLGLFALTALPPAARGARPSIVEMTDKALERLSESPKGFCLMVEGSQIDWQSHLSDFEAMLWETLEFERAVDRCVAFAQADRETLVIVTADHETGGLALASRDNAGISAYWTAGQHTAISVPLYAYGPGCLQFAGTYENTDVAKKIATVLGLDDFPALQEETARWPAQSLGQPPTPPRETQDYEPAIGRD